MKSILFFGDVVGEPGRKALLLALPALIEEFQAAAVIVNGENAAGGRGITPKIAHQFFSSGVDIITLGDHAWDQQDIVGWMPQHPRLLRPFNLQEGTPGYGSVVIDSPLGRLAVIVAMGRTFMRPSAENPFIKILPECQRIRQEEDAKIIIVDIHAEATSEKTALGHQLDGQVTAVIGTHTHVQTGDARILPQGTGYITDAGMCGTLNGVIGRDKDAVLAGLISGLPNKLPVGGWPAQVCGVAITADPESGSALSITAFAREYQKA